MKHKVITVVILTTTLLSILAVSCFAFTYPDGTTPLPSVRFRQYDTGGAVNYVQTPMTESLSQIGMNTVRVIPSGAMYPRQTIKAGFQGDGTYIWGASEAFIDPSRYDTYNQFQFTVSFPSGSNNQPFYVWWSSRYWSETAERYYNINPESLVITRIMYNPTTGEYWEYTVDYVEEYNPAPSRQINVSEVQPQFTCLGMVVSFIAPRYTPTGVRVEASVGMACNMSNYDGNDPSFIRDNAYDEGYAVGDETGYDRGYDEGYAVGDEAGYDRGYDNGYAYGYDDGRDVGYQEGTDIRDRGLLGWIADSIGGFLGTEIAPGFSLGGLFTMIFGALALLWILKLIAGG